MANNYRAALRAERERIAKMHDAQAEDYQKRADEFTALVGKRSQPDLKLHAAYYHDRAWVMREAARCVRALNDRDAANDEET